MSLTSGSIFLKWYHKVGSYAKQSAIVSFFLKNREYTRHSVICNALKKLPGKEQELNQGFIRSGMNRSIEGFNNTFESFRDKNKGLLSSSAFASWLDCSKFLCFPILYFVIDYILRNYIMIDLLSSYWDEAILIMGLCFGLFRSIFQSKGAFGKTTPMGIPIFLFILFYTALMLMNSPDTAIGVEGVRAVTQYMLWYFVAGLLISSDEDFNRIYGWFLLMGTAFALHGIYQFITNVPMPDHWVDMAEKGIRTRSFSIIGSPNILGSAMTLLIPMSLALFFAEKKFFKKSVYLVMTGLMGLCLVFTQSRGAWIGFAIAIFAFFLIYDRRYILPVLTAGLLVFILVPQVYDRIVYMLSEEYIMSSLTGGRLIRWQTGVQMLSENFLSGTGIGRFGGAVAMNHKDLFPDTYYMDNYYLKTAVEGGIFALSALAVLMVSMLRWGFGSLMNCKHPKKKLMITGMLSGLIGVIAHNLFENVFEVPAMVTWFWIIVAMMMYAGFAKSDKQGVSDNG
ncbi:MAG TPA: polymerase [Clostridiales bacterium]|nr:polymerase [Clostridiales bacterium]